MKLNKLAVNASPIISLSKIGYADLLIQLSSHLIIPEGVFEEITAYKPGDPAVEWLKTLQSPAIIKPVEVPTIISEWNLGKGESQVIAYVFQNNGYVAVIDDKAAKTCAEVFKLRVSGTIAIIIKARQMGLISEVDPLLSALRTNGFRISSEIIKAALRIVGENY